MVNQPKRQVVWSSKSRSDLRAIYDFIKNKSSQGARNVRADILGTTRHIEFSKQYQEDEYLEGYRRIIVRHYRIVYRIDSGTIYIVRVFDTRQDPDQLTP